jgi:hypothetical protein
MGPDTIWIFIPLGAMLVGAFAIWSQHRQKIAEMEVQVTAERAAQYAANNRELEERVRVLERIVTDKGYDVGLQIEALRDKVAVEAASKPASKPVN